MPILYSIYRDNRKNSSRKYFARAVQLNTIGTQQLADRIQSNCTLKKSDVLAVIQELIDVMTIELQNSNTVRLDGFGTFKVGLHSTGVDDADDFDVAKNIVGMKVNFLPTGKRSANGYFTRTFIDGAKVKKYGE